MFDIRRDPINVTPKPKDKGLRRSHRLRLIVIHITSAYNASFRLKIIILRLDRYYATRMLSTQGSTPCLLEGDTPVGR